MPRPWDGPPPGADDRRDAPDRRGRRCDPERRQQLRGVHAAVLDPRHPGPGMEQGALDGGLRGVRVERERQPREARDERRRRRRAAEVLVAAAARGREVAARRGHAHPAAAVRPGVERVGGGRYADADDAVVRRRVERRRRPVVAGGGDDEDVLAHRVGDGVREHLRRDRRPEAEADHAGAVVDRPQDSRRDRGRGAEPVGAEHLHRHDRAVEADAGSALGVVGARGDDPGDGRPVAVVVARVVVAVHEVAARDERPLQVGMGEVGARVEHCDDDAAVVRERAPRGRDADEPPAPLVRPERVVRVREPRRADDRVRLRLLDGRRALERRRGLRHLRVGDVHDLHVERRDRLLDGAVDAPDGRRPLPPRRVVVEVDDDAADRLPARRPDQPLDAEPRGRLRRGRARGIRRGGFGRHVERRPPPRRTLQDSRHRGEQDEKEDEPRTPHVSAACRSGRRPRCGRRGRSSDARTRRRRRTGRFRSRRRPA